MRAFLGTAAELLREIYATVDIRIRRAPPSLRVTWIAAVALVVAGVFAATQLGGGTKPTDGGSPPLGIAEETATGAGGEEDDGDGDGDSDGSGAAADVDHTTAATITGQLESESDDQPVEGDQDDEPGAIDASAPGTSPTTGDDDRPAGTGTTTTVPRSSSPTTPPDTTPQGDEPQGLLDALLDLLSGNP